MMNPEIKMADGLADVAVSLGDRSYTISIGPGLTSKVGAKIFRTLICPSWSSACVLAVRRKRI
jgi:hypothetical protein